MALGGTYEPVGGTITIGVDAVSVTGVGTLFTPVVEIGDWLFVNGQVGLIGAIIDDTHLTLESQWQGTLPSAVPCLIIKMSWLRYDPALTQAKLRELLEMLNAQGTFLFVEGDEPDAGMGEVGQWALKTNETPWKLWYKEPPEPGTWIEQPPNTSASLGSLFVIAEDLGVISDDGTVDNTVALQAAVNACTGLGKVLLLPVGVIKITAPISITGPISIRGAGISVGLDSGMADRGSVIRPSGTINAFNITTTYPVDLRDFGISYAAPASTGTIAIRVMPTAAAVLNNLRIDNVGFHYAETAIWLDKTNIFTITRCHFWACRIGIDVQNSVNPDTGDSTISHCFMTMVKTSGVYGIICREGGGLRIENNKLNGGQVGILMQLDATSVTGIFLITGNSIENFVSAGIWLTRTGATGSWHDVTVTGNQFGHYDPDTMGIGIPHDAAGVWLYGLTITGNTFRGVAGGTFLRFISLDSCEGFTITGNMFRSETSGTITIAVDCGSAANYGVVGPNTYYKTFGADKIVNTATIHTISTPAAPFNALAYNGMQINGAMEVSQENAAASIAVATGNVAKYLIDGVKISKSGTSVLTVQQVASVFPGYASELKVTVTTAQASIGGNIIALEFPLEGYRFSGAAWGTAAASPVSVGFWVKSTVGGSLFMRMADGVSVNVDMSPSLTAGVAQWIAVTFAPPVTWAGSRIGGLGATLSLFIAASGTMNIASTVGNTFEVTGLVILPGLNLPTSAQSHLIMRPFGQELTTCQRYWRKTNSGAGIAGSTTMVRMELPHPGMRVAPTATMSGAAQVTDIFASNPTQSAANAVLFGGTPDGGQYDLGNFTGLTLGRVYVFLPASPVLNLDARL